MRSVDVVVVDVVDDEALGYGDFLRARYDRAEIWLTDALTFADDSPSIMAMATTYLGSVESNRENYGTASDLLEEAADLSIVAEDPRREAFALSMLGRINLLRHDLDTAAKQLDAYIDLASRTGMRALTVRSLLHGAALGNDGDAAALLGADSSTGPR